MEETTKNSNSIKFSADETALFCTQMSAILKSGIPLYEGTYLLYEDWVDDRIRPVLKGIDDSVKENASFHMALRESGAFPDHMVHMVEIGEQSGRLDSVMESLAHYYEEESALYSKMKSAALYPVSLFLMMAVVLLLLVLKVLPVFQEIFNDLGGEMSSGALTVMNFGIATGRTAAVIAILIFLLCGAGILYFRKRGGGTSFRAMMLRLPGLSKLSGRMALKNFVSVMYMALASGFDPGQAFEMAEQAAEEKTIKEKLATAKKCMSDGGSTEDAFRTSKLFGGFEERLVVIGLKVGALDTVMKKLEADLGGEVEGSFNQVISVVETVLVGVLTVLVGVILISVMMPLIGIISSIG